ncbi:FIG01059588: hypothetical protein [plant metagenome]|uniref:Schlafen group 3-like DNA/RNA helicase domain-containing protein n=1 Tax=plant metagenome TaxID=1297885 RepID=A0A484TI01_9ZZZZ
MNRAYLSLRAHDVATFNNDELFGRLASNFPFALEPEQRAAWYFQIQHLRELARELPDAHAFMEFLIPRMGRRVDLILLTNGIVFVIEYKLGARQFDRSSLNQVYGYGLDLKNFHETSHDLPIVPVLVATHAPRNDDLHVQWDSDGLARPLSVNSSGLLQAIHHLRLAHNSSPINASAWEAGRYRPTPTIVEAAQALYRGHAVEEISRSEAGAENLTKTADYVANAIEAAKQNKRKIICFITGVPGSGKTLAGLNLATSRQRDHSEEHAVFLSGNGPLVDVLREALALDAVARARENSTRSSKVQEDRSAAAFIQNIHHFRDDALVSKDAPVEKVVVFDEAQRAWNAEQTSKFMQQKKGQIGFSMSEPEFLLSIMDRHQDWCAIICLVGSGQEINTGEAGIEEWLRALERRFPHWQAYIPNTLVHSCQLNESVTAPSLHLATSIRSFRAERLSDFVGRVIAGDAKAAREVSGTLTDFPIYITRNLDLARQWLRSKRRGNERMGLLASSNATRLKPHGVFVKSKIEPAKWFLAPSDDVRSSDALEDAATEFDIQGLELDWICLCWDANYRRIGDKWQAIQFKGTQWQTVNDEARKAYIANAYRVLLTRGRQGMVIFVPGGSYEDSTRPPTVYQAIYNFLKDCGFYDLKSIDYAPRS